MSPGRTSPAHEHRELVMVLCQFLCNLSCLGKNRCSSTSLLQSAESFQGYQGLFIRGPCQNEKQTKTKALTQRLAWMWCKTFLSGLNSRRLLPALFKFVKSLSISFLFFPFAFTWIKSSALLTTDPYLSYCHKPWIKKQLPHISRRISAALLRRFNPSAGWQNGTSSWSPPS